MRAALIGGGTVLNVIVLADGTDLTADLAEAFGGTVLVEVAEDAPVGPGCGYDAGGDPPFTAPPIPEPPAPVTPDPVQATFGALVEVAADPATTVDEKLAGFIDVLASAAPPAPTT